MKGRNVGENMRSAGMHSGTWLTVGMPVIAELAAIYSFDWLLLDLEHGYCTESTLLSNLQAANNGHTALIVRVGRLDPALIARALDWGADGIMLPHVNTADQAKACVEAMQYPPGGKRGYSSSARTYSYGLAPRILNAGSPLFFAQIETCEGVKNAEAIAAVSGVDVLFVGPSDLRMDFDLYGKQHFSDWEEALDKVVEGAGTSNKQAGILAKKPEDVDLYQQRGFTAIAYGSDLSFLKEGFHRARRLLTKNDLNHK